MTISTALPPSTVGRGLGIKTEFKRQRSSTSATLPQRIALFGQGSSVSTYSTEKRQVTSAQEAAQIYGFGSPIHLASKMLFPLNGDGIGTLPLTVYPLVDDDAGVAATGTLIPTGAVTAQVSAKVAINNIESESFLLNIGDSIATVVANATSALLAELDLPMIAVDAATQVDLTSKWLGSSANDLRVEVIESSPSGLTWGVVQPSGGATNPSLSSALAQMGDVWETMVLNCLEISDTSSLDVFQTFGEGRWGSLVHKPLVVFTGNTIADLNTATTVSESRKADRINGQLVAPGSNELPFVIAARSLARIASLANTVPAHDYGRQVVDQIEPGKDGEQWNFTQRDVAIKNGSSTAIVSDGQLNLGDVTVFYHPEGDPLPAYRFVVDIVKIQNVIHNISLEFDRSEWDGAPLIPDDQPTVNPEAKKPRMAKAAAAAIVDGLALDAIISDPESSKENIIAEIDSENPKRLNLCIPVNVSGNVNVKSIDLKWSFFFGQGQLAA